MNTSSEKRQFWRYVRGLLAPVLLWLLFLGVLVETLQSRLTGNDAYDQAALREWIDESRVFRATLPELVREYVESGDPQKGREIEEQLRALADPTRQYQGQLPLFPAIYRIELVFASGKDAELPAIVWESAVPRARQDGQVRPFQYWLLGEDDHRALLRLEYQLHAYNKRQRDEQAAAFRLRWLSALAMIASALAFLWIYLVQRRERDREQRRLLAQQQLDKAERLSLENELRRQEAERKHEEMERTLLEQRLATQAAQGQALELKSQLYASIGIMAGSYAHNIKNLLVRPNDLLLRCLEEDGLSPDQGNMLREVRQTLGTVTERLQQILQTVRRDPSRSEMTRLDLNQLVRDIYASWEPLARDKWKLNLILELASGPLAIQGDASHLQQAIENLLFNARDATFEMRSSLRETARRGENLEVVDRRQALIAAAAWKGQVILRTCMQDGSAILEVADNGIGMSEHVLRRCTETHFSTKRNNAIYEGNTTGMGLGLSFVSVILEHHHAKLEITSQPQQRTVFRIRFPAADTCSE
jgi:signal transduction histidine kinase